MEALEKQKIDKEELRELMAKKDNQYIYEKEKYKEEIKELSNFISQKDKEYEKEIEISKLNNQNLLEALEKQKIDKEELRELISKKDNQYINEKEKYKEEIKELYYLLKACQEKLSSNLAELENVNSLNNKYRDNIHRILKILIKFLKIFTNKKMRYIFNVKSEMNKLKNII